MDRCERLQASAGGAPLTPPLLDELPPEAAAHLSECPSCADLTAAFRLMASDEAACVEPPPPGYWEQLDANLGRRLAQASAVRGASRSIWIRLAVAAALVLVASGAWWSLRTDVRLNMSPTTPWQLAAELERMAAESPELLSAALEDLGGEPLELAYDQTSTADAPSHSATDSGMKDILVGDSRVAEESSAFSSPADALGDELDDILDADEAAELVRRIRAEIAS